MSIHKYSKHKDYGHCYGPTISTPPMRCAWAYLAKPKKAAPPKPGQTQMPDRYELTLLPDKTNPTHVAWMKEVQTIADEMLVLFNDKNKAPLGALQAFTDCDSNEYSDTVKYPFLAGKFSFVARNEQQPAFVGRGGSKDPIEASQILGGNEVVAVVSLKLTAKGGVGYKLDLVQNIKDDGQRYGYTPIDPASLITALAPELVTPVSVEEIVGSKNGKSKGSNKEDALAAL